MIIQIDIPKDLNQLLKIYTAQQGFKNMQISVIKILNEKLNTQPTLHNGNTIKQEI